MQSSSATSLNDLSSSSDLTSPRLLSHTNKICLDSPPKRPSRANSRTVSTDSAVSLVGGVTRSRSLSRRSQSSNSNKIQIPPLDPADLQKLRRVPSSILLSDTSLPTTSTSAARDGWQNATTREAIKGKVAKGQRQFEGATPPALPHRSRQARRRSSTSSSISTSSIASLDSARTDEDESAELFGSDLVSRASSTTTAPPFTPLDANFNISPTLTTSSSSACLTEATPRPSHSARMASPTERRSMETLNSSVTHEDDFEDASALSPLPSSRTSFVDTPATAHLTEELSTAKPAEPAATTVAAAEEGSSEEVKNRDSAHQLPVIPHHASGLASSVSASTDDASGQKDGLATDPLHVKQADVRRQSTDSAPPIAADTLHSLPNGIADAALAHQAFDLAEPETPSDAVPTTSFSTEPMTAVSLSSISVGESARPVSIETVLVRPTQSDAESTPVGLSEVKLSRRETVRSSIDTTAATQATFDELSPTQREELETPGTTYDFLIQRLESQNALLDQDPKAKHQTVFPPEEIKEKLAKAHVEAIPRGEEVHIDWDFWGAVTSDYESVARNQPRELSKAIQRGIPPALRGLLWQLMSASKDPELERAYAHYLRQTSTHEKAIMRDLNRTFPQHEYFKDVDGVGQENLFNVVKAYSLYDEEVGYCQGLPFVVGPLLLQMPDEEAFCVLVRLMKSYDLRSHFTPNMPGLQLRLFQFDRLLEELLPTVFMHLLRQGVKSSMYASQWFLTLFGYRFPLELVSSVMDLVFAEGVEAIFRFAVALMKKNEEKLLKLDFERLLDFLKADLFESYLDPKMIDNHEHDAIRYRAYEFVREALQIKITPHLLDTFASEWEAQLRQQNAHSIEVEQLRAINGKLSNQVRKLEASLAQINEEHCELVKELVMAKLGREEVEEELVRIKLLYAEAVHAQAEAMVHTRSG
ncbi:hypothetical protein E5Q_05621 [Mixia osmundae IAM 14324]|uniref:GTPase-activating protein GYP5 n=1 Tax=Mixia osmundae (strain CBS 9802 / IAM 14324 / JCM 22182 / KY 12970) TaxID=764103 RepID=G7E7X3_MIXOS|nr:hypothetical protein E5Q_05621 [Mixia osmundae IAM 14324]